MEATTRKSTVQFGLLLGAVVAVAGGGCGEEEGNSRVEPTAGSAGSAGLDGKSGRGGEAADTGGTQAEGGTSNGDATGGSEANGTAGVEGWLYTSGNHIYRSDGSVFRGRGANVHDTRSCWRCAWNEPDPDEVIRYIDALVDDWHANFIRLVLESYGSGSEEAANGALQYGTVVEDPDYLADLERIVNHIGTKPGVVVLMSVWADPTIDDMGWPSEGTQEIWRVLTQTFSEAPHVIFGLVNEPENNYDGSQDAAAWEAMNSTIEAIRDQEDTLGSPHHVVAVQGTGGWARFLDYYTTNPITAGGGDNIAYEVHVYDAESDFDDRFVDPSRSIPVVIGEFGPVSGYMSMDDCSALMEQAEALEVPYLGWTFHMACEPNLLDDTAGSCSSGEALQPTAWGELLRGRLAESW